MDIFYEWTTSVSPLFWGAKIKSWTKGANVYTRHRFFINIYQYSKEAIKEKEFMLLEILFLSVASTRAPSSLL
jgi:hypothetical protein